MLRRPWVFVVILLVQSACALFFVSDIMFSVLGIPIDPIPWRWMELIEIAAAIGLIMGVALGAVLLRLSLRRTHAAEQALRVASGAFMELIEERFNEWGLTPAERDVALFALKGLSLSEIAQLRATSEGTVKAQTNAIYRKADVSGRPQLMSVFVDELMDDGIVMAPQTLPSA